MVGRHRRRRHHRLPRSGRSSPNRIAERIGVGRTIMRVDRHLSGPAHADRRVAPAGAGDPVPRRARSSSAGLAGVVYNINQVSFRQAITPRRMQGRMNATMRFIVWGTIPIGSIVGGMLGGDDRPARDAARSSAACSVCVRCSCRSCSRRSGRSARSASRAGAAPSDRSPALRCRGRRARSVARSSGQSGQLGPRASGRGRRAPGRPRSRARSPRRRGGGRPSPGPSSGPARASGPRASVPSATTTIPACCE